MKHGGLISRQLTFTRTNRAKRCLALSERRKKEFWAVRPDGNGGWLYGLEGISPVPYRLPEVIEAVRKGEIVFVVEGEKGRRQFKEAGSCGDDQPWRG